MRLIKKGNEPRSLVEYRLTQGASYAGLPSETKAEMRARLVSEQHGLCCFCMERITPEVAPKVKVKIAHWEPQDEAASRALDWTNLLVACSGNEGAPYRDQHCDTRQGNTKLSLSPLEAAHVASLSYSSKGEMRTSRSELQADVAVTLNLNVDHLKRNRAEALTRLIGTIPQTRDGRFTEAVLERALRSAQTPDADGKLPPFAGMIAWWLTKRLGKAAC